MKSQFYSSIFSVFLIDEIPSARELFSYCGNVLSGTDKLIEVIRSLRRKSKILKTENKLLYDRLYKKLDELEDELITTSPQITEGKKIEFEKKVDERIDAIYSLILNEIMSPRHIIGNVKHKKIKEI